MYITLIGRLRRSSIRSLSGTITILFAACGCTVPVAHEAETGPSPAKTPQEELAAFKLESGLKIQLVASEPMVQEPVVITFDEDGRLWVVEMRGFMPTIDGEGEDQPSGRVSILEDTDGDGLMDKSTIYLDSLIMPRALAVITGGALVAENEALWLTEDTDGDLRADTKTLIDPDYAGNSMPEHSGNGLWRGVDNWYYNAKSRLRYRLVDGEWRRDSTEFRGQWGISHDDKGRLFYNYNWSQLHADLVPPNYLDRNKNHIPTSGIDHGLTIDRRVYPIRSNPAVNRGYIPGTLDENERLLEFTAACAPLVFRGQALPEAYYGNAFVCEPSGNLIKRNVVQENGFVLSAYDPHPGTEFLASTDERFRPVNLATGPDGALYVADMYRGLIQHGAYVTPYLREQTLSRKLVQPVHMGRIWRIVPEDWTPAKPAALSTVSSAGLVEKLSHPDGWHRDMAQRLLVERSDGTVAAQLRELAQRGNNPLGRFHALWTLEGLNLLDSNLLFNLLDDQDPLVKTTALRLLEPFAEDDGAFRKKLGAYLLKSWREAPIEQVLQMALSAGVLDQKVAHQLLGSIAERYGSFALVRDAVLSAIEDQEFIYLQSLWKLPEWKRQDPHKEIFIEMLTAAVVRKRDAGELGALLAMLDKGDSQADWRDKTVITAMAIQGNTGKMDPVKLPNAPAVLSKIGSSIDQSRKAALLAMFEWPGHVAANSSEQAKSILNEAQQKQFAAGRQHYLTTCAGCHGTDGAGMNRLAPPLIGSDWVLGDEKRLALVILHGLEGPLEVNGKVYDAPAILPVMPAHSTMDDGDIAAILTYIRNEWGNSAGAVSGRLVGSTRHTSQGRVVPWTAGELNKHIEETRAKEASIK